MPTIKLKLNTESLNQALKELKKYQKKVDLAGQNLTHSLTEQGVSLAQLNASYMSIYDTGELVRGIESRYVGGFGTDYAKGYVMSTAPHSKFCEFGTGIKGKNSPHPNITIPGWQYDENNHGEAGWWYWKDGEWHWTAGMPSRPYMYDTAQLLRQMVVPTAKEVLK